MSLNSQKRDLIVRIDAETRGLEGGVAKSSTSLRAMERELKQVESRLAKQNRAMTEVGRAGVMMGAALAAGIAVSVKAAIDWESAWAGVQKTTQGNVQQMAALEGELRNLAKTLPIAHKDLAGIAEAAGQLGIKRQDVAQFTSTIVAMGSSTNLSFEEAATSTARFLNVMGLAPAELSRVGSTLVELGNNSETTEAEIMELGQRLAASGRIAGLSASDVLAFAATLTSVGVEAEAGGTALSKVFISVNDAVLDGSDKLDTFARVAGMSAEEFSRAYRDDAAGAVASFTEGLGRMSAAGESTTSVFNDLELTDQRLMRALLSTGAAGDHLRERLEMGNDAWAANTALMKEAEQRYDTTASKLQVARNNVNDLAIGIGSTLLPAVAGAAGAVGDFADMLGRAPEPVKALIAVVGTLTALVGLAGGAALITVPKFMAMQASIATLSATAPRAAASLGVLSTAMKGLGIAGAVVGIAVALDQLQKSLNDVDISTGAWREGFADFAKDGKATGEVAQLLGEDFGKLGETLKAASSNRFSLIDGRGIEEVERAREVLKSLDEAITAMYQSGNIEGAAELYGVFGEQAAGAGMSAEELAERFPGLRDAMAAARAEAKESGVEVDEYGRAVADAAPKVAELTDAQKALESALATFSDPMQAYTDLVRASAEATAAATADSEDSWSDYADSAVVSLDKLAERLEQDTQAAVDWQANLSTVAATLGEDVARELASMGEEGYRLTAQMATDTTGEAERMGRALVENARLAKTGMGVELDAMVVIAAAKGRQTAQQLATTLGIGVGEVARIAAQYGLTLAAGINPILTSLGRAPLELTGRRPQAQGLGGTGGMTAYATGGPVWGAGTSTSDSIPAYLSNGEYVIKADSVARYGQDFFDAVNAGAFAAGGLVRRFATGGFVTAADVPKPSSTAPFGPPVSTAATAVMVRGYEATVAAVDRLVTQLMGSASATGLNPQFLQQFNAYNAALGNALKIVSGFRSNAQQKILYDRWVRRVPGQAPAAPPGRSNHERGLAIDHAPSSNPRMRATAGAFGLRYPMSYEPWHVEPAAIRRAMGGHVGRRPQRFAVGGPVRPMASNLSLSGAAAAMARPEDMEALLKQWDRYLEQLEQAARRTELLAAVQRGEADALQRLREFDVAAYRRGEVEAVERLIDSLERERKAREDALEAAKDAEQDAKRAAEDTFDALDRMLDQQESVQRRQAQATEEYARDRLRITERLVQAEADLYLRQAAATRRFADEEQRILAGRRDRLANAFGADQIADFTRSLPAGWLVANVRQQVDALTEWMSQLDLARQMGVSEQVIEALGLDEGPQALYQVKALTSSTAAELDELNEAVAARTRVAGERARTEAASGLGQLGRDLADAHRELTVSQADALASYRDAQAEALGEMEQAQAEFLAEQAELTLEMAAIGTDQGRSYSDALAAGLTSGIPAVEAAARALADATRQATAAQVALVAAQALAVSPLGAGAGSGASLLGSAAAAGMSPDAYATAVGGQVLTGRIRDIFANRRVSIATATESEEQRLARLAAEVLGGRSLDSVRTSVDRLRASGIGVYDAGGWLPTGLSLAYNGTGQPERVMTAQQVTAPVNSRTVKITNNITVRDAVDHELLLRQQAFQVQAGAL